MHSHGGALEPYRWPEVAKISRDILSVRYSLLPYYYTLFHLAHTRGGTVWRPLFFEFPEDVSTWAIDRQFLIGSDLLVSPVLEENVTSVNAYFPAGSWYARMYRPLPRQRWFTPIHVVRSQG